MNQNKFCFIICTNSQVWFEECKRYIGRLYVPDGYEIDLLAIEEATSMAAGYNEGMNASDAKYKIYIHHDVFIVNRYFLYDILKIFNSDAEIGMIGAVGAQKLSCDGVMWYGNRVGKIAGFDKDKYSYDEYQYQLTDGMCDVVCVDGCLIVTQYDIYWREDLFKKWDFYDVSQGFEFKKAGYRVVVPEQKNAWIVHDSEFANMINYNKYRHVFLDEYRKYAEYME